MEARPPEAMEVVAEHRDTGMHKCNAGKTINQYKSCMLAYIDESMKAYYT